MYSFGMDKIIKDLQTGKISSGRQLWYLIIGGGGGVNVLDHLFSKNFHFKDHWNNISGLSTVETVVRALAVLSIIAIIFGFLNCYWINQRRDNQDFILRYIVLAATISWRLVAAFFPIYLVIWLIKYNQSIAIDMDFLELIVGLCAVLLYYGLMNLAFAKVAGKERA